MKHTILLKARKLMRKITRERERESKTSQLKSLALLLASASMLAGLDIAKAACRETLNRYTSGWSGGLGIEQTYTCTGSLTAQDKNNLRGYAQSNYYVTTNIEFGTSSQQLNLTSNETMTFSRYGTNGSEDFGRGVEKRLYFGRLNARDIHIKSVGSVRLSIATTATTNMNELKLESGVGQNPSADKGKTGTFDTVSFGHNSRATKLTVTQNTSVSTLNVMSQSSIGTIDNSGAVSTLAFDNSSTDAITNNGSIGTLNLNNNSRVGNLTNSANKTINTINLNSSSISGTLTNNGTINTLTLNASSIDTLENKANSNLGALTLNSGSSINSISNPGAMGNVTLNSGSNISTMNTSGYITTLDIRANATLARLEGVKNTSTIQNLILGSRASNNTGLVAYIGSTNFENFNIANLTINGIELNVGDSNGHIKLQDNAKTNARAERASIVVTRGAGVEIGKLYEYKSFIKCGNADCGDRLNVSHFTPGSGFNLKADYRGFYLEADASNTYGAGVYRALALSSLRRNTMTQDILDTMTTKTFHSDKYYNSEVELRLLQYDMSRLTNRSTKFAKLQRKNTTKIDKVRQKIAKLTLEQSKGQDLDKGYNNFELIDQLDAIFIPYTGRRDWRFFALPYASHTYGYLGANEAIEYSAGAIFGIQRNLKTNGIFGGYVGYEFGTNDTQIAGSVANVIDNSLNAGLNYFKSFSIASKVWEGFIKANLRAGVDFPQLSLTNASASNVKLQSNSNASNVVLMWNVGAEIRGGITFYQFKRNSYIAPEIGLSYDMLSTFDNKALRTHRFLITGINDEFYDGFYWHLPQVNASVRYYKIFGNTFRLNAKMGIKYNMLNKQRFSATLKEHDSNNQSGGYKGVESTKSNIVLPSVYGNLALDFIWMIRKNHELSLGYDGLFFASSFAKQNGEKTDDWFNGVTTTINLKYAYWFGGSDYVTDKDGNAISRSILEGKKSKKSKKDKPKKKSKKSKKKVYYIDG